jgi:hypothetical protein
MDTILDWYIKDRVILYRPSGEQTLQFIQQSSDQILKLLDEGNASVHICLDARFITKVPTNLLKLSNATTFLNHPSIGWVITISNDAMIKFLGAMLPQLKSVKHNRVISEPEKALAFLKEQDSTLDWSNANDALFTI